MRFSSNFTVSAVLTSPATDSSLDADGTNCWACLWIEWNKYWLAFTEESHIVYDLCSIWSVAHLSSNSKPVPSSGNVTSGSSSSGTSTIFSNDDRNRFCSCEIEEFDRLMSSLMDGDGVIAARELQYDWLKRIHYCSIYNLIPNEEFWHLSIYLISDIEFLISLRSRFSAIAFNSADDWVEDDADMWCNLCDDDALATRDVVVLDFVDDVLLLKTCWKIGKFQSKKHQ